MIALLLALLTTICGSGTHNASVAQNVHASAKVDAAAPKTSPAPLTAHPLAG
jgi:hypothetical protein